MGRDLASLKCLYMSDCESLEGLPNTIGNMESLNELNISGTGIKELPNTLWTLEKLEVIEGKMMHHFHMEIGNCIYRNRSLRILKLYGTTIHVISRLPESLTILKFSTFYTDELLDLSNLPNLKELWLDFKPSSNELWLNFRACDSDGASDGLVEEALLMPLRTENLSKLESLSLSSRYTNTIQIDMRSLLPQLRDLSLSRCPNLHCLPSLPFTLSSLELESECLTTLPMDISSLLP